MFHHPMSQNYQGRVQNPIQIPKIKSDTNIKRYDNAFPTMKWILWSSFYLFNLNSSLPFYSHFYPPNSSSVSSVNPIIQNTSLLPIFSFSLNQLPSTLHSIFNSPSPIIFHSPPHLFNLIFNQYLNIKPYPDQKPSLLLKRDLST